MRKTISIETLRLITLIILLMSICTTTFSQSPYAIFGDNSKMLEAKKVSFPNIYRVGLKSPHENPYYVDFDMNKGLAILSDADGNVILQDSISETAKAMFTTIDPHAERYYHLSPYSYCGGNPISRIDPTGMDWYQNSQTSYYTWFDGDEAREGFTYIGCKGSILGEEFESVLNNILCGKDGLGIESLYSNGFTFDIAPIDKGGLIQGWDFFDEFVKGSGPEFTVFLENHPYTQAIMNDGFAMDSQDVVKARGRNGKYTNVGRPEFFPWQASPLSPMQFIGTYRYDGYSNGQSLYNVATDSKSVTSLCYHIPFLRNHRRSQQKKFGNTYQFYLWRSPR